MISTRTQRRACNYRQSLMAAFCLLLVPAAPAQTVTEARQRFARERAPLPEHGLYEDFRGLILAPPAPLKDAARNKILITARQAKVRVIVTTEREDATPASWRGLQDGVAFLPATNQDGKFTVTGLEAKSQEVLQRGVNAGFDASSPSNFVTHILAREFTEPLIREALAAGHFYVADDWLCDPTGFMFGAINNQGVFTMGDEATTMNRTRVMAVTPVAANLRLFRDDLLVKEASGTNLIYETKENGSYRLEAWLQVAGTNQPWIFSSPISLRAAGLADLAMFAPLLQAPKGATVTKDISYLPGSDLKHKLDVYTKPGLTNAPVLFFIHGGAWKTGDRSYYGPLAARYVREGFMTVLPSYRLAPKFPHPAQIEDVASAFAWTMREISARGGDTNRIYVGGHSAGGHLAALLALDDRHLAVHGLSPKLIRGVLAFSGVYNLTTAEAMESVFGKNADGRRDASPLFHIKSTAPPFLVTYCEWDYFSLPAQAREFFGALRKAGIASELVFVPRQDHLSEMINVANKDDPTVAAAVKFMK